MDIAKIGDFVGEKRKASEMIDALNLKRRKIDLSWKAKESRKEYVKTLLTKISGSKQTAKQLIAVFSLTRLKKVLKLFEKVNCWTAAQGNHIAVCKDMLLLIQQP